LERHDAGEIGLTELAQAAGMSIRSFHRHFKISTGMTPAQYLLRHRIAAACRLLRESATPVQTIAAECGIPDPVYFCRLFRKTTGMTPGAFRRFR
jgi:AraC-like DNA-binding protein